MKTNSDLFIDYLKSHLETYPKKAIERETILLAFYLGYKNYANTPSLVFRHWDILYPKGLTPKKTLTLCESFVKNNLGLDMSFSEAITFFKTQFPKNAP